MTDEAARELAAAINRLSASLERATGLQGMLSGGIQVHHHGFPSAYQRPEPLPITLGNLS